MNKLKEQISKDEQTFFKNYNDDKQVENFNGQLFNLKNVSSIRTNTSAGDVSTIFTFMKTLGPLTQLARIKFEVC